MENSQGKGHRFTWEELESWQAEIEKHRFPPEQAYDKMQKSSGEGKKSTSSSMLTAISEVCSKAKEQPQFIFDEAARQMEFEEWLWANASIKALHKWIVRAEEVLAAVERYNNLKYAKMLVEIANTSKESPKD